VVAVHALFVVLESVAACFIARSFFDNVIGLEKIVAARTAELDQRNQDMRVVLDNVDQVLLTLDKQAVVGAETSKSARNWLGDNLAQRSLQDVLSGSFGPVADDFAMGWEQLTDGFLPADLALEQLPSRLVSSEGKTLRLEYKAIEEQGELSRVLVVGTDVTAELNRSRLEAEQKEMMAVFDRVMRDKRGFLDFFSEAEQLVEAVSAVRDDGDLQVLKRRIHTLKGNAAIFNLSTIAQYCHELETAMEEECRFPTEAEQAELSRRWSRVQANLESFLGNRKVVEIGDDQFSAILRALLTRRPHDEVAQMVSRFKLDRAPDRLQRFAEQAQSLAARLGKGKVEVNVECDELYFDPVVWSPFWAAFVHSVRNAVDHGIESAEERVAAGKTATGHLTLSAKVEKQEVVVAVADDGRGIDWTTLGERAKERGLHCKTREELVEALFFDGVSTAETVTEISGRGVGMGALREACASLGGYLEVPFVEGPGTIIEFRFPRKSLEVDPTVVLERNAA
jgi:two-component system chemotaxis sensor kinase CheA